MRRGRSVLVDAGSREQALADQLAPNLAGQRTSECCHVRSQHFSAPLAGWEGAEESHANPFAWRFVRAVSMPALAARDHERYTEYSHFFLRGGVWNPSELSRFSMVLMDLRAEKAQRREGEKVGAVRTNCKSGTINADGLGLIA